MPHAERLRRLQTAIQADGLDALIVTSLGHIRYLTDTSGPSLTLVVTPAHACMLVHFVDLVQTDARLRGVQLRRYEDRLEALVELFDRWRPRRVGFEGKALTYAEYHRWSERLAAIHLVESDALMGRLRERTDPAELVTIRQAVDLADRSLTTLLPRLRPGVAEAQVAGELARDLLANGAERLAYLLVQFGLNTAQPQARPSATRLQEDDLIMLDLGPVVEGARASVARPVVAGTPTAEQRRVHQAVQQAYFAALHQVRPGVTGHLVDRAAREVLASAGYGRYFGHAVGRGLHAGPRLRPRSDAVLEEGMVVTIGPGVYIPGWGGLRIEDTVVVGRQGCDVLSTATTDLLQVPPPVVAQPDLGLLRLAL